MQFLLVTFILCLVFWLFAYLGTGTDEKNIKSYSVYPDAVQEIVKQNPLLADKIKEESPLKKFLSCIVLYSLVLLLFGLFIRGESFLENFFKILVMGYILNLFDFVVMDLLWWRNTKRIRFEGTKENAELYQDPKKHAVAFAKALLLFLIVAVIDGGLLSLI